MAKKRLSKKLIVAYYQKHKKNIFKRTLVTISSSAGLFLVVFSIYSVSFASGAYNHIYLGNTELSGKNRNEIKEAIQKKSDQFINDPIILSYNSEEQGKDSQIFQIEPKELGISYDVEKTADKVLSIGRNKNAMVALYSQLLTVFKKTMIEADYHLNEESVQQKIMAMALELDQPEKDFELIYSGENFQLTKERKAGRRIDQNEIRDKVIGQIASISKEEIVFSAKHYSPQIKEENAQKALTQANNILEAGNLILYFKEETHFLEKDDLAALIVSSAKEFDLLISVNKDRARKQIEVLARAINQEPKNAGLKFIAGKVQIVEQSQEGREVDMEKTVLNLENAILARILQGVNASDSKRAEIVVNFSKPKITSSDIDSYGLVELVSSGTTSFYGSSENRKHNIANGANAINGTLIAPNEEFSTLKTLGKIDAESGYLEELVIKENRTVAEYGGGLCQVSTTLFRAALNAGMEIIERKNHKYRVSYYEPPIGMDATIYDPAPDFRFKNNYNSYIFIQSTISGTKITFDFYGTKDSRKTDISNPEVFDWVEPGQPVIIVSESLKPGEKQRIEKAHQGVSSKFHYKVERDGSILQERDFNSKYVAWPEKWLAGPGTTGEQIDNDQDGIINEVDNCMDIANPDQQDDDKDNIGNLCDNN